MSAPLVLLLALAGCFPRRDWVDTGTFIDQDGDGYGEATDCAPMDPGVHPGAMETCDGVDEDCDGLLDDADPGVLGTRSFSTDADGDGWGDAATAVQACEAPAGMVSNSTDCDDTDPSRYPGAAETCDGVDNDCDGTADDGAADAAAWYTDADSDGWGDSATLVLACSPPSGTVDQGGDCNDANAAIRPEAVELCDALDNDCDSSVDEGVVNLFYRDRDLDGYGDLDVWVEQCPPPTGYVANATDCDDGDDTVHPDATEYCDDVDQDCDTLLADDESVDAVPWYPDRDGDGWGDSTATATACDALPATVADGTDCDDTSSAVHPGAMDLCGSQADGVDNNCDGVADDPSLSWSFHVDADGDGYGTEDTSYLGCDPAEGLTTDATDCNDADARAHPGGVERFKWGIDYDCDGDLVHTQEDVQALLLGASPGDQAGNAVGGQGDLDGDGILDLAVGAWGDDTGGSGSGGVYLWLGSAGLPSGTVDLSSFGLHVTGGASGDEAGWDLTWLGDTDGDGRDDLLVGAPGANTGGTDSGVCYLASGAWLGSGASTLDLSEADAVLVGETAGDRAGTYVSAPGDLDDDGLADLLVGAPERGGDSGTVYLVTGPLTGSTDLSLATASVNGQSTGDGVGPVASGGDINGDGAADLVVGSPGADGGGANAGAAWVFLGPVLGPMSTADADLSLEGEAESARAGSVVRTTQDADGDGVDDVLVGSPGESTGSWSAGSAYLLSGATLVAWVGDTVSLAGAHAVLEGEIDSDNAGCSLAGTGDMDGDDIPDLLVGAWTEDSAGTDAGAVYLVTGPLSGTLSLATSLVKIVGADREGLLGSSLSVVGDLDGDTLPDFLAGAPSQDTSHTGAGAAWLFLSGSL